MRSGLVIAAFACLGGCGESAGPLLHALDGAVAMAGFAGTEGVAGAAGGDASTATGSAIRQDMDFQYQLVGEIDPELDAQLFFVDLFNTDEEEIDALHARGKLAVAYLSAGTLESYRDDVALFPRAAVGQRFEAYPNESWLDVRDEGVRERMAARLQRARDKGFDGVLPTNLTSYRHDTGFDLDAADQLDYTGWLADEAHRRGLEVGMADDFVHAPELSGRFDWAVHFSCIERGDCAVLAPFMQQGKPVFDVEVTGDAATVCARAADYGINAILKDSGFGASRVGCP